MNAERLRIVHTHGATSFSRQLRELGTRRRSRRRLKARGGIDLWRDKEEKGRAAETAYRDWRRAESLNIERRSLADRISPARRSEYERRIAECKAKKAAYRRASAVFHDAGRKYKTALSRWQHEWAGNVTNAKKMLGVPTNATEEEIKSAYRRAAKLYHPDRAEGNGLTVEEATRAFRQIQEAYEVLCAVFVNRVRS